MPLGIIAEFAYNNGNCIIGDCFNKGNIEGTCLSTGGILGYNYSKNLTIYNCHNEGKISLTYADVVGGVIGYISNNTTIEKLYIANCYNISDITIENMGHEYIVGGVIAWFEGTGQDASVLGCYNKGDIVVNGKMAWNESFYIGGVVGAAQVYRERKMNITDCYNIGNLTINNIYSAYVGGILGINRSSEYSRALIKRCYNEGTINCKGSSASVGGIVAEHATIEDCYNIGNLNVEFSSKNGDIGGISAYGSTINNCYNKGIITYTGETSTNVGGIAGSTSKNISNSYNVGDITYYNTGNGGDISVGGICGEYYSGDGSVSTSYNEGDITCVGGKGDYYVAGIIGLSGTANYCYNTGNINCSIEFGEAQIGGILGRGIANNCYNAGNIKHSATYTGSYTDNSRSFVGGILGTYGGSGVSHCYNVGNVSSNVYGDNINEYYSNFGAIAGYTGDKTTNSYYSDKIKLQRSVAIENGTKYLNTCEDGTKVSDEYMKSRVFFDEFMEAGATNWYFRGYTYPKLSAMPMEVKQDVELTVENTLKQYDITTYVSGSEGGTISGQEDSVYETVKYGESNKKEIVMQPDEDYGIAKITINGKEIEFTTNEDGSYTLPVGYFYEMNEDKQVIVTYATKNNILTIKKVDSEDPNLALEGAKFKVEQVERRQEVSSEVGELTDNSKEFATPITSKDVSNLIGELENNSDEEYHFVKNSDGTYVSNNVGRYSTTAHSYFKIDLTDKEGIFAVVLNAKISAKRYGDYGYAVITKDTSLPIDESGRFMDGDDDNSRDYTSYPLEGGDIYYLHIVFVKLDEYGTLFAGDDKATINSIKLYEANISEYNFENVDGKYVSSNTGHIGTVSSSYIPIDLTNTIGQYNLKINAQVSSADYRNFGYVKITESEEIPDSSDALIRISGEKEAKDYTTILQAGKKYYVHLVYDKTDMARTASGSCTDKFTINSIELSLNTEDFITTEVTTNSEGIAVANLHPGTFKITELEAPDGYKINTELENEIYTFEYGKENILEVKDQKSDSLVTVHYYEKGTGPEHNCEAKVVSEDVELRGNIGEEYKSQVIIEKDGYTLMKDEAGEYVIPDNASGSYGENEIDVYYYYEVPSYSYSIHYLYDGIENEDLRENIPVDDIGALEDGTIKRADIEEKIEQNKIDGYYIFDVRNLPLTITEDENNNIIEVYYEKIGTPAGIYKLNVTKVNENNPEVKVEGAEFEVYEVNGETETKVGTLTHKGNGLYESEEINITKEGTINVKLKETKVPSGYKAIQDITGTIKVEVQESEEEFKYVVTESTLGNVTSTEDKKYDINFTIEEPEKDAPTGTYKLNVTKVNENNPDVKVEGAEFEVYEVNGGTETKVGTLTHKGNGLYESEEINITKEGTINVKLKETKVPNGYKAIQDITGTIKVEVQEGEEEFKYVVTESTLGNVTSTEDKKYDINFTIEEPEKDAPTGTYKLNVTKVNENNPDVKVEGAEFEVYEVNGGTETKVGTLTHKGNGLYESEEINITKEGTINVKLKETKVPNGYKAIQDITGTIKVEVQESEEEFKYVVTESTLGNVTSTEDKKYDINFTIEEPEKDALTGKYNLVVTKVNEENPNEKVPGAEFGVYEIDGETETKVGTLTDSNNDGIYESGDLAITEVGTKNITIKETKVPTGFAKIADKTGTITFEKSTEKEEYTVKESSFGTVENGNIAFTIEEPTLKGTYSLEITKVDTEGNKVSGAEFTVYDGTTEIAKLIDNNNDGIYESGNIGISNKGTISITIEETIIPKGYIKANDITGTITFEKSTNKEEYIVTGSTLGNVSEDGLKISLEIIEEKQKDEKYDLAIKKFVSAIDGKKITTREPKIEISEDGTITYSQNNKIEKVANNQEVTYTIRTYNESNVPGKGKRAIEYIPDGLVFLPNNKTNIDNEWVMYIVNGDGTWTKTDDPEKAKIVVTDKLVNKEIAAVDGKKVNYEDVEAIFKVDETKVTSKDRIIENTVEIKTNDNSNPGENPDDNPGAGDNDNLEDNPTNNKTSEKLYVKYFDLSMKKYIKQVVITDDKNSETIEVAKESQKDLKVNVNLSKVNKTTLTITYVLEVKNVGEIEGNADKISEYIPEEFNLDNSKAIWKIDGDTATTESLKEVVIKPGETKEIEVVCTWKLSENTSGVRSNKAKIEKYSNPYDAIDLTNDNEDSSDIEVIIINDKYDLAIKKFISAIDNEEITTRAPKVEVSQDGKITYTQNSEIEKAANNQEVTYTLRMYNESDITAKGKRIIEYVPDGLVFLPENETNKKYNWVMFKADENGKLSITQNTEEATIVVTDYLVNKEINAFNKDTDTDVSYLDVQAVFKVDETKLTSKDRIIENKIQIMPNENDDNKENDESSEKLYVKYFDLSIEKYIDEVKVDTNGNEKIVKVGYDKKDELVKIDVKRSEVDKTKLTVTYGLLVRNVGEIAGYATEIKDYIPKDFTIVNSENWKLEGNEAISTQLEDMLLEPGESTIVYITCEWKLSEGSIGERYNEAEILKYKNDYDAIDITGDNKDKEGLLVTLKTGSEIITYINIAVVFIVIITTGTYFIKRKVIVK